MSTQITNRAAELLATLQANTEGWHSRAELAELMGKKRLNPHELDLLDQMGRDGLIRVSKQDRGINRAIVYRAKES
jgi:hypothetical protein